MQNSKYYITSIASAYNYLTILIRVNQFNSLSFHLRSGVQKLSANHLFAGPTLLEDAFPLGQHAVHHGPDLDVSVGVGPSQLTTGFVPGQGRDGRQTRRDPMHVPGRVQIAHEHVRARRPRRGGGKRSGGIRAMKAVGRGTVGVMRGRGPVQTRAEGQHILRGHATQGHAITETVSVNQGLT